VVWGNSWNVDEVGLGSSLRETEVKASVPAHLYVTQPFLYMLCLSSRVERERCLDCRPATALNL
jgi:hypothetical protein